MNHKDTETQSKNQPRPYSVPLCLCGSIPTAFFFACAVAITTAAFAAAPAPLADALEKKDLVSARALLRDTNVNAAQPDGTTALHWAVRNDDLPTAKALLTAGADPKATNRYGVTPLSLACTNGSAAIITLLLDAGADANLALRGGETPLMTAARTGKLDAVKILLARGVEVNAKLPFGGQTALMWATADGHAAVVDALLAAGADFRTPLDTGFTPLLFAARAGHAPIVRALLNAGVDVNEATKPTRTAGKKLPRAGTSALIIAVENGHFELAAALLDLGANPNDLRSGYAPLHVLSWVRKPDSGEDDGQPVPEGTGLYTSEDLIKKLVAKGADLNLRLTGGPSGGGRIARKGCTPFMMAADTADTAFMKLLVALGADPTIPNADGCTPLMAAAGLGTRAVEEEAGTEEESLEAVAYLLSLGADINAVSNNGDTAMHGAAFDNFPKVVKFLDARGARIEIWNQPNKRGWTPLLIAEGHRYGNFKPSFETIAAFHDVLRAHGLTPPPPTPRIERKGYADP